MNNIQALSLSGPMASLTPGSWMLKAVIKLEKIAEEAGIQLPPVINDLPDVVKSHIKDAVAIPSCVVQAVGAEFQNTIVGAILRLVAPEGFNRDSNPTAETATDCIEVQRTYARFMKYIQPLTTASEIYDKLSKAKYLIEPEQRLIERAWERERHATDAAPRSRPWPWADTWPVARLEVPALGVDRLVLAGAHGSSLPFGPGHVDGSALPGDPGSVIIAGHQDTHFQFLRKIEPGVIVRLTSMWGREFEFEVIGGEIVDARLHGISPLVSGSELVLVTCQPTDGMPFRGPYRLIVTARPVVERHPMELPAPAPVNDNPFLLAGLYLQEGGQ